MNKILFGCSMYDVDGNGWIDLDEMTRLVGSIFKIQYSRLQPHRVRPQCVQEEAREIFNKMDTNSDGKITKEEFTKTCMDDKYLIELLTPPSS